MRNTLVIVYSVCVLVILSACGGSDDATEQTVELTEAPEIKAPRIFLGPLSSTNSDLKAGRYIRNGLYYQTLAQAERELQAPVADSTRAFSASDGFSTTTTQESDVDEADRIEFDGNTFYIASFPNWYRNEIQSSVRVLNKQQDGSLEEVSKIELSAGNNINGMYLNAPDNSRLSVVSSSQSYYPIRALIEPGFFHDEEAQITLDIFDVNQPNSPTAENQITIQGYLLGSRRIDQTLYLVSSFSPAPPKVNGLAETPEQKLANYRAALVMSDAEILPTVKVDGVEQRLLSANDCAMPANASADDGFSHIIQVTKVDLANNNQLSALCTVNSVNFLYMSSESLYLVGEIDNTTQFHKIALLDSFSYVASGAVAGSAGWQNPHLRLSEYQGKLRFVSSDYSDPRLPFHRLYVLEQQGNELASIAMLPEENAEQGLGKPGEDVYAVRYVGNKGYVVTFERIDPLYVIDLSDSAQPSILGELEIPGFSSYLQPIGEDYLLGVGQQVDVEGLPENGQPVVDFVPVVNQMKVSLFDVRDPTLPTELSSMVLANSYTPVEFDYRALSVLVSDTYARFGLPIESWHWQQQVFSSYHSNSLIVLDVNRDAAQPSLELKARLTPPVGEEEQYIYAGEDRSVLVGNDVYYLRGNQIWYSPAADEETLFGPY